MTIVIVMMILAGIFLYALSGASGGTTQRPRAAKTRNYAQTRKPIRKTRPIQLPDMPASRVLKGKCHVIDGDTIASQRVKIRLAGIDAPELDQPWGQKSKWAMVGICKGKVITAKLNGERSHDRLVGVWYLPSGEDIAAELVKQGLALDWKIFSGGRYREMEPEGARKKLWKISHRYKALSGLKLVYSPPIMVGSSQPTKNAMKPSATFWNMIARRYAKSPVDDQAAYQIKLDHTRGLLRPDMNVLEFGCGTGSTAIYHAPVVDHILAVDISHKMLAIAQAKALDAGISNIELECSSIDGFQRPTNSFDVVLGMSILHLVDDKDAIISKVFDMLKPGGAFVSSTVCLGGKYKLLQMALPIARPLGLLPLLRFFTPQELVEGLKKAGFEIEHQAFLGVDFALFAVARKPA